MINQINARYNFCTDCETQFRSNEDHTCTTKSEKTVTPAKVIKEKKTTKKVSKKK